MKKLILLFAVLSISFISCKKDKALTDTEITGSTLENATVIKTGNFSSRSDAGSGSVKIYLKSNGEYVLGLEQMDIDVSASLVVYLSTSATVSSSAIKIYSVKNLNGNVFHSLPNNIDFTAFKYLIIETELSEEIIGSAELR
jgi:hypothetical protein